MPPPLESSSEDESGGESIPFKDPTQGTQEPDRSADDNESESGSEGEGDDVYVVEKIVNHEFGKGGKLLFQVKWKGYDNPEDLTLEPEENLSGAPDALQEYFTIIGGRPEKPTRKRKSMGGGTTPKVATKKAKKSLASMNGTPDIVEGADWVPKSNNWDKEVRSVETIIRDGDNLYVLLHWNNEKKAKVSLKQCYEKCPQKMLKFYENHLYANLDEERSLIRHANVGVL
uniref:Chromo domain-containing protein n=1 Tax=Coccidioides posadasii RMSCC 3488 TaxID=454284 RepID=A0A0J6F8F6_COCPO|nr:hypothetical protein, variant [Coccidioides posadasii RMSCC 3488]